MADSLCGPSNALQNFQKHASTDRTLQQDRLASRQSPAQSFRSAGPNAGVLDPEFEFFQAGNGFPKDEAQWTPEQSLAYQDYTMQRMLLEQNDKKHRLLASMERDRIMQEHNVQVPVTDLFNWAHDFAQSNPDALSIQPRKIAQPRQSKSSWHQDFMRQNASPAPAFAQAGQSNSSWHQDFMKQNASPTPTFAQQGPQFASTFGGFQHSFAPQINLSVAEGKQKATGDVPQYDEAAFERAFAMADEEVMGEQEQRETILTDTTRDAMMADALEAATLRDEAMEAEVLKAEALHHEPNFFDTLAAEEALEQEQQQQPDQPPIDDEELAKTAGQLLDSVSDNTSEKFQNSSFLALMRRLRDHEVRVQGGKMVEVSNENTTGDIHRDTNGGLPRVDQQRHSHRHPPPDLRSDALNTTTQPGEFQTYDPPLSRNSEAYAEAWEEYERARSEHSSPTEREMRERDESPPEQWRIDRSRRRWGPPYQQQPHS